MTPAAFVSGRLQFALVSSGGFWRTVTPDGAVELARTDEINLLTTELAEFRRVPFEDTDTVVERLNSEITTFNALFLILSILSDETGFSTKLFSMQVVDDLLASGFDQHELLNILLSSPLPSQVRAARSSIRAFTTSFDSLNAVIRTLFESQESIDQVYASWNQAKAEIDEAESRQLETDLRIDGTFALLVRAAQVSTVIEFNTMILDLLIAFPNNSNVRRIIEAIRVSLQRSLFGHRIKQKVLRIRKEKSIVGRRKFNANSIDELITADIDVKFSRLSAFDIKTNVDRQIAAIKKELLSGRDDLIEKFAADLVHFQLEHSERSHLAKSLCLLASASLDSNRLEIADLLSNAAINLGIEDQVVFTSRAEVLKGMGLFGSSLRAFQDVAYRFPSSDYAWVGIADVLKEMGRYSEAKSAYREAQIKFPDSPVPFNGLVSVIRYEGNHMGALKEAFAVAKRFPEDPFSRGTLAGALASNGRYKPALRQYEIAEQFSGSSSHVLRGHIRALNSLGRHREATQFLRSALRNDSNNLTINRLLSRQLCVMGAPNEALELSRDLLNRFPGYLPARLDMANAQLMSGDVTDALLEIGNRVLRSETEWRQYRMLIASLMSAARYNEASELLANALNECAWILPRLQFETMLGWCKFKLGDAVGSIRLLQANIERLDDRLKQARLTLVGAVQLQAGEPTVGRTILTRVVNTCEAATLSLRDEALSNTGDISAASILRLIIAA